MLGQSIRRWTVAERDLRIRTAPQFGYATPVKEELNQLVRTYVAITSDPVATWRKRNMVATCYRVHGDDFLVLVEEMFAARGTATNLLGEIRCLPPREGLAAAPKTAVPPARVPIATKAAAQPLRTLDCGCDIVSLLAGLIYCEAHRPPFDGSDTRRHDRRPSSPDAARFFTDADLGALPSVGRAR